MILICFIFLAQAAIPIYIGNIISPNDFTQRYNSADFPFCSNSNIQSLQNESFLQKFNGQTLNEMGLNIDTNFNVNNETLCQRSFTQNNFALLKHSIQQNLFIQFVCNGKFSSYAPIGYIDELNILYYYSHWEFTFYLYKDQIVAFIANSSSPIELNYQNDIYFYYSVTWSITLSKTLHKSNKSNSSQYWYHFYSIMKISVYMIAVFSGLGLYLIHKITKDFQEFQKDDQFDDFNKDSGFHWRLLHGDIFRKPYRLVYLSSFIGSSFHLITTIVLVLITLSITDFANTFGISYLFIIMYVLSSIVSGYITTSISIQYGERKIARSLFFTSLISSLLAFFFVYSFQTSFIACFVISLIIFISNFALNFMSGYIAPNYSILTVPCDVAMIPRRSPNLPFLLSNIVMHPIIGSIISFFPIHEFRILIETLNNNELNWFVVFSLTVFLSSVIIIIIITISYVYILIKVGWFKWQWKTFRACFTSGFYLLIYLIFYINTNSSFTSVLEVLKAYLFAIAVSAAFGLACGGVGYMTVNAFLTILFSNLKFS